MTQNYYQLTDIRLESQKSTNHIDESPAIELGRLKRKEIIKMVYQSLLLITLFIVITFMLGVYWKKEWSTTGGGGETIAICILHLITILLLFLAIGSEYVILSQDIIESEKIKKYNFAQNCRFTVILILQVTNYFPLSILMLVNNRFSYTTPIWVIAIAQWFLIGSIVGCVILHLFFCVCKKLICVSVDYDTNYCNNRINKFIDCFKINRMPLDLIKAVNKPMVANLAYGTRNEKLPIATKI